MIDPKLIDVQHKFDGLVEVENQERGLLAAGAVEFPEHLLIDRDEWTDRLAEIEKHGATSDKYSDRFTHQGNSHECVSHAAQQAIMTAYNRQLGGVEHSVWFSPLALYTRITGGRQWGGSNVMDSLYEMMENGMIPDSDGPAGEGTQAVKFKHTLYTTAGSGEKFVKPRDLPDGWEQTAKHFRVLEAFTIPDEQAHFSAVFHGMVVVNGRQGHSIPHFYGLYENRKYYTAYKDSYDRWLYDSERLWGGGYCIRSVTTPDDPNNPAGPQ